MENNRTLQLIAGHQIAIRQAEEGTVRWIDHHPAIIDENLDDNVFTGPGLFVQQKKSPRAKAAALRKIQKRIRRRPAYFKKLLNVQGFLRVAEGKAARIRGVASRGTVGHPN